jgi:hypothetical protein
MLSFTFEVFIKYHLQKQGCTPFGQKPLGRKTLPTFKQQHNAPVVWKRAEL